MAAGESGRELIDERTHRQRGAVAPRLREADREILAHPIDGKSEVELALEHRRTAVLHLPRLRGTLGDDVDYPLAIEAGAHSEIEPLGETLHDAGDADLIDHLGELAAARGPHQRYRSAVVRHHRFSRLERVRVAADHDGELAVLCTRLTARDRRIQEGDTFRFRCAMKLARNLRRGRGVVREDGALLHADEGALGRGRDLAHVMVVAHTHENDVGALGRGCRRLLEAAAILAGPGLRLRSGAVIDRDLVAVLLEMTGHRIAHHAETQECQLHRAFSIEEEGIVPPASTLATLRAPAPE